ncbi:MAG: metalloregulator ArsR/SmtB family transcription factor [Lachnospiraceae bacterium]|nr:metalloregulator ArsR/SmtB family transcription factor [Lachnospiraceae bacterium]
MTSNIKLPHVHNDEEKEKAVIRHLPGIEEISRVAGAMKQLGDPLRARIFWLLCHTEECVINIAALMDMSSPAVAHHLKLLKDADLIVSRREGKEMYYRAADSEMVDVLHHSLEAVMEIACPK